MVRLVIDEVKTCMPAPSLQPMDVDHGMIGRTLMVNMLNINEHPAGCSRRTASDP
jgi:hypothetical protein